MILLNKLKLSFLLCLLTAGNLLQLTGCGGGSDSGSPEEISTATSESNSNDIPFVQGEWSGRAFVSRVECGDREVDDFNFGFGVNQSGNQVLVSYERDCSSVEDEVGTTTATGFVSQVVKIEKCSKDIEAPRIDRTEISNINGDTAEVRLTLESTCPNSPCLREWVGTMERTSREQFNCR